VKVEGLGNDFVLLDWLDRSPADVSEALDTLRGVAPAVCDRRRGVGADGLLILGPPSTAGADASMWVVNHDGSRPEMCGNGLRCVALYAGQQLARDVLVIDTDAGPKTCRVEAGTPALVQVDMGAGARLGVHTPAAAEGRAFIAVSMGNPHAIVFVEAGEDPETLARSLGPQVEVAPEFPDRTNVEFARLEQDGSLTLWVWERGVGITEACGTGACAAACAACWLGLCPLDSPIRITLPGGPLEITVPADRNQGVQMRGPARLVFHGTFPVDPLDG
jgi:diaminopimelate epimerase